MSTTYTLERFDVTNATVKYQPVGAGETVHPPVKVVYFMKDWLAEMFGKKVPKRLVITIEEDEEEE